MQLWSSNQLQDVHSWPSYNRHCVVLCIHKSSGKCSTTSYNGQKYHLHRTQLDELHHKKLWTASYNNDSAEFEQWIRLGQELICSLCSGYQIAISHSHVTIYLWTDYCIGSTYVWQIGELRTASTRHWLMNAATSDTPQTHTHMQSSENTIHLQCR